MFTNILPVITTKKHQGWLFAACAAMIVACVVSLRYYFMGASIEYDSVLYISMAYNFINGNGFLDVQGYYSDLHNPVSPALWGIIHQVFNISIINAAAAVNVIALSLTVFISVKWICNMCKHTIICILASLLICFNSFLLATSYYILTDTLFNLFVVLSVITIINLYKQEYTITSKSYILCIIFMMIAVSTRWLGIALIGLGVGVIFLNYIVYNDKKYIVRSIILGLIAILPLVIISFVNRYFDSNPYPHLSNFAIIEWYYLPFFYHIWDVILLTWLSFFPIHIFIVDGHINFNEYSWIDLSRYKDITLQIFRYIDMALPVLFVGLLFILVRLYKKIFYVNSITIIIILFVIIYSACLTLILYWLWPGHPVILRRVIPIVIPVMALVFVGVDYIYGLNLFTQRLNQIYRNFIILILVCMVSLNILASYSYFGDDRTLIYNDPNNKNTIFYKYASDPKNVNQFTYYSNNHYPMVHYYRNDLSAKVYNMSALLDKDIKDEKILLFLKPVPEDHIHYHIWKKQFDTIKDKFQLIELASEDGNVVYEVVKKP